jgi:hypothetical protein
MGGVTGDVLDLSRPVWVRLPALFIRRPDAEPRPPSTPRPLDTTGDAPGTLHAWLRSGLGDWIGLVSYQVPFADGRHDTLYLERQLLPAYALRPRKYGGSSAS